MSGFEYGDPRLPERFWDKVYPCPWTGCWLWGAGESQGYGRFAVERRMVATHRLAYMTFVGSVQGELDHLCRQRSCCNPAHLEDVTHFVNWERSTSVTRKNRDLRHCPQNHPYEGDNLYVTRQGYRHCRTCHRDRVRLAERRRRAVRG